MSDPADIEPLWTAAGFAPLAGYTFLRMTGKDRAAFLHGLCTNDIKRLEPGDGCEAFITNVQGKTLAFGWIFADSDALEIELATAQAADILRHFDKYIIREDVQVADQTADLVAWLVAGPDAPRRLAPLDFAAGFRQPIAEQHISIGGAAVRVRRVLTEPLLLHLVARRSAADDVAAELTARGLVGCSPAAAEIRRVACGLPHSPQEVNPERLPQEVGRDRTAISFTKGCYLGQETVARLDALGHVNRRLMGLLLPTAQPLAADTELNEAEKVAARVTSSVYVPALGRAIALAYVRRGCDRAGNVLAGPDGPIEVYELPFASA